MADNTNKNLRNQLIYQVFVRNFSEEGTFGGVQKQLERIKEPGTEKIHSLGMKCMICIEVFRKKIMCCGEPIILISDGENDD